MERATFAALKFDERGLIPAILQDWRDGTVLMVAHMNREALEKTVETGIVHFWSRSRQSLWEKGATSGNRQRVQDVFVDCDQDTLLITVTPDGPACHTGEQSCFFHRLSDLEESCEGASKTADARGTVMDRVYETIISRKREMPSGSYVTSLLKGGQDKILKKITEEATEVIMASKGQKREEIVHEAADLVFHLLMALGYHDIPPGEVYQELARRFGQSGLAEKASRSGDVER
jgi:phosphoribosyl-ATP pyrophosphohydrolase/phosphoribosyl-AMP cyclohydrolase